MQGKGGERRERWLWFNEETVVFFLGSEQRDGGWVGGWGLDL